ncbi:hypothetical protein GBAR_LOCUS5780 [Geodia barretti]|uniref:Uncharacterized protein n=1 Tax=Geodia barretti TaxID=519541 RepID=A0AA35RBL9_GEOBA|nr:hypothetical protein GBAR_LOCUS5780 [Geodia barretti]
MKISALKSNKISGNEIYACTRPHIRICTQIDGIIVMYPRLQSFVP